jgi:hypothetical protein
VAQEHAVKRRLPWLLLAAWAILCASSCALQIADGDLVDGLITPALGVLAVSGALLGDRRPGNPVGWILLALALLITLSVGAEGIYGRFEGDADPGLLLRLLVWFDEWIIFIWFGLVGVLLPLLFPDGRLPSRRWRPLLWAGMGVVAVAVAGTAFGTERFDWGESGSIANPLALGGLPGSVLAGIAPIGGVGFAIVLTGCLAGVAVRLRRSSGVERQQLKWFAFTIGLLLVGLSMAAISEAIGFEPLGNVGWTVFLCSLIVGMPVAIAVAILRHRLYDIDVVIRRTLVYGALTATLAAAYLGLVLLAGLAVGQSDVAIAVSTLAVAALFRPARLRIQAAVDRRFYRRRYDAAQTLDAFGGRLRDQVDLETLAVELRGVIGETMQPAHVSLWLKGER